jgi:hypothetical protein
MKESIQTLMVCETFSKKERFSQEKSGNEERGEIRFSAKYSESSLRFSTRWLT